MAGQAPNDIIAGLGHAEKIEYERGVQHPASINSKSGEIIDGIHDGLKLPTDEEKRTLRRVPDTIPVNAYRTSIV